MGKPVGQTAVSTSPKTLYFILAIFALGFVDGATSIVFNRPGQPSAPISFVITVTVLFLQFLWYRLDSDSRQFRRTPWLSISVVGLGIVALPYYLFRTRGRRQGAFATFAFILLLIGYSAFQNLGQLTARASRIL